MSVFGDFMVSQAVKADQELDRLRTQVRDLKAQLASAEALEATPFIWAIETPSGDWHDGEDCVFGDLSEARSAVESLNEELPEAEWFRVVPLYRKPKDAAAALERRDEAIQSKTVSIPAGHVERGAV